ncbi:MAG: DUF2165 domain-containing protein [Sedimentitalea sp.]
MLDQVTLFAQFVAVTGAGAWLATGVWDNIAHPANNETYTAQVMGMERMAEDYPEQFQRVAHRAITTRPMQKLAFRVVVLGELVATLVLLGGSIALILAMLGLSDPETARAISLLGAALFTAVWSGFLVVGNYFCYWFCHEWGQNTHYQMTLWGLATMIFLVVS